jgi:SAM-dependent methyltransferase
LIPLKNKPSKLLKSPIGTISSFLEEDANISRLTVESFGNEWQRFADFEDKELEEIGADYFNLLPRELLAGDRVALDVGCGSGRWTRLIAPKFRFVEAVDPSSAVFVAQKNCSSLANVRISMASVSNLPFQEDSFDLVFSLGVLHHIPDTADGIKSCVKMIRPGGYFLVYLYYSLDNRGWIFKTIFRLVNLIRSIVSKLPHRMKNLVCDFIALFIYLPMATLAKFTEQVAGSTMAKKLPLNYYRNTRFQIMRNDALDRFGTPLEQRFSKAEIQSMMEKAGLTDIKFSPEQPFWVALGRRPVS